MRAQVAMSQIVCNMETGDELMIVRNKMMIKSEKPRTMSMTVQTNVPQPTLSAESRAHAEKPEVSPGQCFGMVVITLYILMTNVCQRTRRLEFSEARR